MFRFRVSNEQVIELAKQVTIDEFFAKRQSFTAHDVSRKTREVATEVVDIQHEVVRQAVHEVMQHAGRFYCRSNVV